jgi:hypothetical protein
MKKETSCGKMVNDNNGLSFILWNNRKERGEVIMEKQTFVADASWFKDLDWSHPCVAEMISRYSDRSDVIGTMKINGFDFVVSQDRVDMFQSVEDVLRFQMWCVMQGEDYGLVDILRHLAYCESEVIYKVSEWIGLMHDEYERMEYGGEDVMNLDYEAAWALYERVIAVIRTV